MRERRWGAREHLLASNHVEELDATISPPSEDSFTEYSKVHQGATAIKGLLNAYGYAG
jgi:hypothetical protein